MTSCIIRSDRRKEERVEADDTIRWKRPGVAEDHKAWMIDRSPSGLGLLTIASTVPRVGDIIHVRQLDQDRWTTVDRFVRVVRTAPTSSDDLVTIGCKIE